MVSLAGLSGVGGGYLDAASQMQQMQLNRLKMQMMMQEMGGDAALGNLLAGGMGMPGQAGSFAGGGGPGMPFQPPTGAKVATDYGDTTGAGAEDSPAALAPAEVTRADIAGHQPVSGDLPSSIGGVPTMPALTALGQGEAPNYGYVGPYTGKEGRPLGRYGIMSAELPEWSKEVLGYQVSEQEFLSRKDLQDQIAARKFGSYANKYGLPSAASIWLTGHPLGTAGSLNRDMYGSSGPGYAAGYMGRLQRAMQPGAVPPAPGGPTPQAQGMGAPAGFPGAPGIPGGMPGGMPGMGPVGGMDTQQIARALLARGVPPAMLPGLIAKYNQFMHPAERENFAYMMQLQRQQHQDAMEEAREQARAAAAATAEAGRETRQDKSIAAAATRQAATIAAGEQRQATAEAGKGKRQATAIEARLTAEQQREEFTLQRDESRQAQAKDLADFKTDEAIRLSEARARIKKENAGQEPTLKDDEADFYASQELKGNNSYRGLYGTKDVGNANKALIAEKMYQQAKAAGMAPDEVARAVTGMAGAKQTSRTLGSMTGRLESANSEMLGQIDVVQQKMAELSDSQLAQLRGRFRDWNALINAAGRFSGDPQISAFIASVKGLRTAYSKVIAGGMPPRIEDGRQAEEVFNVDMGDAALKSIFDTMKQEGRNQTGALAKTVEKFGGTLASGGEKAAEAPQSRVDKVVEAFTSGKFGSTPWQKLDQMLNDDPSITANEADAIKMAVRKALEKQKQQPPLQVQPPQGVTTGNGGLPGVDPRFGQIAPRG